MIKSSRKCSTSNWFDSQKLRMILLRPCYSYMLKLQKQNILTIKFQSSILFMLQAFDMICRTKGWSRVTSISLLNYWQMNKVRAHENRHTWSLLDNIHWCLQWPSHWWVKGDRVPPLTAKNLSKIRKKGEKIRKIRKKRRKIRKKEEKSGRKGNKLGRFFHFAPPDR